ncbi:MAG: GNAT family N-acetyltransferase [Clostridia bacterium]|nr:GNAT family N-acetyltransferase [Clostridia bacterium]
MLNDKDKRLLEKNKIKNINLLNFAEDYDIKESLWYNQSYVITGKSDHEWTYIHLEDPMDLNEVMRLIDDSHLRWMIQDELVLNYAKTHKSLEWILSCKKLIYKGEKVETIEGVEVLRPEDAEYIQAHNDYGEFTDINYIKERISKGIGLCIKINDQMVGWVLTHDDGAIGFIKVLEAYRNKGYAKKLTDAMIYEQQKRNLMSFVHIEKENIKSMNLALKAGFEYVGDVHWVKIKE